MKMIVNADDFGLCQGQNLGIQLAHRHGIVTSASLMPNMKGFVEAVNLAHENPNLGIGVHLVLSAGKPVLHPDHVPSLIGADGYFKKFNGMKHLNLNIDELEKEWRAQIEKVISSGIRPDHLDGHHHLHQHPDTFELTLKLAKEYKLPIRYLPGVDPVRELQLLRQSGVKYAYCVPDFYKEGVTREYFLNFIGLHEHLDQDLLEVMCHPAYLDPYILLHSSYNLDRVKELAILTDESIKKSLLDDGIQLTTFKEIQ